MLLTDSRVLALPGPARHIHQVRTARLTHPHTHTDLRSIGDSDDDLGRMLGTLRFWFTKDLVRGTYTDPSGIANAGTEIRQGQAMQALQLHTGRVLQGMPSAARCGRQLLTYAV